MQTFLPYENFQESANVLDKKRCWKQVVEAKQIIETLELLEGQKYLMKEYNYSTTISLPWINHPAVLMWKGHTDVLKYYFDMMLQYAKEKHRIKTKYQYILQGKFTAYDFKNICYPWWLGNEDFHRAMRARLIEKDRAFYLPLFPKDEGFNGGKYLWPVMETKTFRII